jgi:hypothetical protein
LVASLDLRVTTLWVRRASTLEAECRSDFTEGAASLLIIEEVPTEHFFVPYSVGARVVPLPSLDTQFSVARPIARQ